MKTKASKNSRIVFSVSVICLLFLATIWVSYFRQKSINRKEAVQFAIEKNSNLAIALEQFAISTIHNADAVLQLVRVEYAREGKGLDLKKLLAKTILNRNLIGGLSLIDNRGNLVMSNLPFPNGKSPNFSDRDYFIFQAANSNDSLHISKPIISRATGKPAIVISRRLNNNDGSFGGLVALVIEPTWFTSFYAAAKLLPNDIISLVAPDGITYARRTGAKESSGEDIHKSPLFHHAANNPDSFYFAPDAVRGIPTWFSYRKFKNYPVIATVGSSESDILAFYARNNEKIFFPRIIMSALVILFSITLALVLIHRRKSAEALAEEKRRYENLLTEQMIAVQEREREWIGRELHDNVNQVLTTVKLYLETASRKDGNPLIPRSMQLINSSIVEIRNLSHQLSAPTLGTRSLIDSISGLVEMVSFSTNLAIKFNHAGYRQRVAMSQKLALYRILQEQLNNIIKHAGATKVWITLTQKDNHVLLTVKDNGKGFDPKSKIGGMGLNNITSRIKVFGGHAQIESAPGKGCTLRVTAPIFTADDAIGLN
jgi:signal transduction histidine kinase